MVKGKQRINCYISEELYTRLVQSGRNITEVVIEGIELVLEPPKEVKESSPIKPVSEAKESIIEALKTRTINLEEQLNSKDTLLENKVRSLEDQLKVTETSHRDRIEDLKEQFKVKDENQLLRIADLKEQISSLHDQLRIKDEQIKERDSNIKSLTTITESQTKSYRLIEAPVAERKKPWWKLW
jgi:hypothetical protein